MLDTFYATLTPMLVMFSCILVGFILRKTKAAPENTGAVLSNLLVKVFLPAQIIHTFAGQCTLPSIMENYQLVLYGLGATAAAVPLGIFLSGMFTKDPDQRNIYKYAMISANFGFLGNAVVLELMGSEGLYRFLLFTMPLSALVYSWLIRLPIPVDKRPKGGILGALKHPCVIAIFVGMGLGLTGLGQKMPTFLNTALGNLSGCMGPGAMLLTGFVVGGYNIPKLLSNKKIYIAAGVRLFVIPAIMAAGLRLAGANENTLLLSLYAFGTALGLNTVVIPAAYGGDTHTGAAMAMISHVAAVFTLPLLHSLILYLV